ncbi:hypothetical protein ACFLZJ_01550 [Nanoarchaeota archaeon]
MNKRGQFYLLAAFIIIGVMVAFIAISNYSERQSFSKIKDLGAELSIEGPKVIDYGTYNGTSKMENFTQQFATYAGSDVSIYYVVGKEEAVEGYWYSNGQKKNLEITEDPGENKIFTTINEIDYEFDLMPGENFYYVVSQFINGEEHVLSG